MLYVGGHLQSRDMGRGDSVHSRLNGDGKEEISVSKLQATFIQDCVNNLDTQSL